MTGAGEVIAEIDIPKNFIRFRRLYAGAYRDRWPFRYALWTPIPVSLVVAALHIADPTAPLLPLPPIAFVLAAIAVPLLDAGQTEIRKWRSYSIGFPTDRPIRVTICTDAVEWTFGDVTCRLPYGAMAQVFADADRLVLTAGNRMGIAIPRGTLPPSEWDTLVADVLRRRSERRVSNEPGRP